ncbi:uncharacterized protein LY79DRAFT_590568 [Colletotrichum navitas]|uniref:LysM domain-containing protein n=1 Tax=Colletotrichum navitas TaxID=681940 RepID=A0AAD8PZC6_9PEZI|nr:uncharacterized protein LY79DRAFT_590568 [Colletotrichum navitas]KAK1590378.1 hypothetical protein LY79DRAFT_590568 [Colletotrichum navitas]
MWLWGADHIIDDPDLIDTNNSMVQPSIHIARGFLIESTKPTWLYGTASEHSVFYQYNFHSVANIYVGMLQTESPYYQPTPPPPAPFAAVWFSTYDQSCIDTQECQKALMLLKGNFANIRIQNLVTIGAKYMAIMDGEGIPVVDNLNVDVHPDWSHISVLDVGSNGTTRFDEVIWVDPIIWEMDQPQFTCSPPCSVKIPPWTGATSVVDYPLITVSSGSWTSTITQPPLTITEWVFEVVTLSQGAAGAKEKRAADAFWPVPATTPFWPAVVYTDTDGRATTTSATVPFPDPPASIGPDALAPPSGSWPKRAVQPMFDSGTEGPLTNECSFLNFNDPNCVTQPWFWGNLTGAPDGGDIENLWDLRTKCPPVQGDPRENLVKCYNSGEMTEDVRMQAEAASFCGNIEHDKLVPRYFQSMDFPFNYNGGLGTVTITISMQAN